MKLEGILLRFILRLEDHLRVNNYSAYLSGINIFHSLFSFDQNTKLKACERYLINNPNSIFRKYILKRARNIAIHYKNPVLVQSKEPMVICRSIIVKRYVSKNERGILIIIFENELLKLVSSCYFSQIESKYQIIFIPSWHPFYTIPVFILSAISKRDFFIMPSSFDDMTLCYEISKFCQPLPFHAASWINDEYYTVENKEKEIDIIMIANFSKYKRHWRLFEALRELPKNLVVYLAGVPLGSRTHEKLINEAKAFGVENRISIFENIGDDDIIKMMARAKIFCALSHKEGPFIAVAESMMAGTPVGMYENAMIGTKSYINDETGIFFSPNDRLAPQIASFLKKYDSFKPSHWAKKNISSKKNCESLNKILREYSASNGYIWSVDLEPFYCRRFDFFYRRGLNAENDFKDAYEEFRKDFRLTIDRPKLY